MIYELSLHSASLQFKNRWVVLRKYDALFQSHHNTACWKSRCCIVPRTLDEALWINKKVHCFCVLSTFSGSVLLLPSRLRSWLSIILAGENSARCWSGGNFQYKRSLQGGDADFPTGNGGEDIDRQVNVQVISFALEGVIGQYVDDQI